MRSHLLDPLVSPVLIRRRSHRCNLLRRPPHSPRLFPPGSQLVNPVVSHRLIHLVNRADFPQHNLVQVPLHSLVAVRLLSHQCVLLASQVQCQLLNHRHVPPASLPRNLRDAPVDNQVLLHLVNLVLGRQCSHQERRHNNQHLIQAANPRVCHQRNQPEVLLDNRRALLVHSLRLLPPANLARILRVNLHQDQVHSPLASPVGNHRETPRVNRQHRLLGNRRVDHPVNQAIRQPHNHLSDHHLNLPVFLLHSRRPNHQVSRQEHQVVNLPRHPLPSHLRAHQHSRAVSLHRNQVDHRRLNLPVIHLNNQRHRPPHNPRMPHPVNLLGALRDNPVHNLVCLPAASPVEFPQVNRPLCHLLSLRKHLVHSPVQVLQANLVLLPLLNLVGLPVLSPVANQAASLVLCRHLNRVHPRLRNHQSARPLSPQDVPALSLLGDLQDSLVHCLQDNRLLRRLVNPLVDRVVSHHGTHPDNLHLSLLDSQVPSLVLNQADNPPLCHPDNRL